MRYEPSTLAGTRHQAQGGGREFLAHLPCAAQTQVLEKSSHPALPFLFTGSWAGLDDKPCPTRGSEAADRIACEMAMSARAMQAARCAGRAGLVVQTCPGAWEEKEVNPCGMSLLLWLEPAIRRKEAGESSWRTCRVRHRHKCWKKVLTWLYLFSLQTPGQV